MSRRRGYNKKSSNKTTSNGKQNNIQKTLEQFKDDNHKESVDNSKDGKSSEDVSSVSSKAVRKTNDPAWYMYSPEQVDAVARLPFSEAFGDNVPVLSKDELISFNSRECAIRKGLKSSVPGVAVLRSRPTFGANFRITDPLNVCATELYTFVRYVNNGRKNYDPADLMIHVLAIADAYSYIMWMKKIYGLAFMYSTRNYYYGKAILAAMGIDPESIVRNLANMRYWLNTYINKVSAYVVPETINLFKRRAFLYADVYTESDTENVKDQLYTFTPDGFFKFGFNEADGSGMLKYLNLRDATQGDALYDFEGLCEIGESLFENISQDEDFGLMSGDLLKAFGTNIIKVDSLAEEYFIDPHYDHEVLHQIMNATVDYTLSNQTQHFAKWGVYDTIAAGAEPKWGLEFENGNVYQTPNGILMHAFTFPNNTSIDDINVLWNEVRRYMNVLLNTDNPQVNSDHVMEMTRMTLTAMNAPNEIRATAVDSSSLPRQVSYVSCGSDVITNIIIARFDDNHNVPVANLGLSIYAITEQFVERIPEVAGLYTLMERVQRKICFKYLPPIYEVEYTEAPTEEGLSEFKVHDIWQNLENYTLIDPIQLDRIHRVAMYSLAHVPGVSRNIIS